MENKQEAECLILLDGPKREIKKGIYFSSLLVNLCHKLVLQVVRQEQGRRGLSPGPTRMSGDCLVQQLSHCVVRFSNYRIVSKNDSAVSGRGQFLMVPTC